MDLRYFAMLSLLTFFGCATSDSTALGTPKAFSEAHVFHTQVVASDLDRRELKPGYWVVDGQDGSVDPGVVASGDPLTLVLHAIYLPEINSVIRHRDVVLLLDLEFEPGRRFKNIAIAYQLGVHDYSALNLRDLVVFSTMGYDNSVAPYLRLRLLDVVKRDAEAARSFLESTGGVQEKLGVLLPNPYVSAFGVATQLGALVLGGVENEVLMDYEFQLFPYINQRDLGSSQSGVLQVGQWLAVGLPNDESLRREFWGKHLYWDARKARLVDDSNTVVQVPVVVFEVHRRPITVPSVVHERSVEVAKYIGEQSTSSNPEIIAKLIDDVVSAQKTYDTLKQLHSRHDRQSIGAAMQLLFNDKVTDRDKASVIALLRRLTSNKVAARTPAKWKEWFETEFPTWVENPSRGTWEPPGAAAKPSEPEERK